MVELTGGYFALSVGDSNGTGDFVMTGGTLTAKATSNTGATSGIYLWGNLNMSGGSAAAEGDYALLFVDADVDGCGGFSVTGGRLEVTGTAAGVVWRGYNGMPSITENVTVAKDPADVKILTGSVTNGEYTNYAAAYTDGSTTALEFDEYSYPTNGVKHMVFGADLDTGNCTVSWDATTNCTFKAYTQEDRNGDGIFTEDERTEVSSGEAIPAGTTILYEISDITEGYRIKSVTLGGTDRTEGFVNGVYGALSTKLQADTRVVVTLEPVPATLPRITQVVLYTNSSCTTPAADMTVNADTRFYAKASYSDDGDYPNYYIGGVWEYSTDGTTWQQDEEWGVNRFDYWPGWSYHTDFDFVNGSYDLRVRIQPRDLYSTGEDVLSNVIHINGGAGTSSHTHTWGEWSVTKPATCTEDGTQTRTCTNCGHSENGTISMLGHLWGDWVTTKEPTETENGTQTRTCQRAGCGERESQPINKLEKQAVYWALDKITWTYGGTVSAQNTAYNTTEGGGALTYSSSDESVATVDASGKAAIVGAGTATITATAAAVSGQYAETSASYTLTVNKAPLTITANDASISYGEVPTSSGWTGSGYAYSDDAGAVTGTPVYSFTYEQYGKAGTYSNCIQVSGLSAQNYEITYAPGTLTVNKAADYTIMLGKLEQLAGHVSDVTAQISPYDETAEITVEYQKDDGSWTTQVPQEAAAYAVRAALTASENMEPKSGEAAYTTDTLIIQTGSTVAAGDSTVTVGTTVTEKNEDPNSKTAEITVSDEQLTQILENANGDVSVDLSGIKDADELVLPGSLVSGLSQSSQAAGLTVATEDASITMSAPVVDTVADAVTSGEDKISVRLTTVEEEDLSDKQQAALVSIGSGTDAVIVEVSLIITHADDTTTELHQLGGNVEVKVPYAGAVPAGKSVVVCYLSDDGNVTYVRATYDEETRQICFNTNHFSHYALFVSGDPVVIVESGSGSGLYKKGATVTITADEKSGYRFDKWVVVSPETIMLADTFNATTTFVMPAEDVELKATYTQTGSESGGGSSGGGSASYAVSVDSGRHGSVTVSPKSAGRGNTVTITVTPDDGYKLDELTVKDKNGNTVSLTAKGSGRYTFTMPGGRVTVEASFVQADEDTPSISFDDVPDSAYYADAVAWAVKNGITSGTSDVTFGPDVTVTRAQMMTFLWRAAGSPRASGANPFADVSADVYYYDAVLWAVSQGITSGTSNAAFSPDAPVTRAQAVTFLWRANGSPAVSGGNFADVTSDTYYTDAVAWAVANDITSGTGENKFSPETAVTRAQAITFLWRSEAD